MRLSIIQEASKMTIGSNILQAIGNTSLVQLRNVVPPGCAQVFVKLEWENPTGSMKDRIIFSLGWIEKYVKLLGIFLDWHDVFPVNSGAGKWLKAETNKKLRAKKSRRKP